MAAPVINSDKLTYVPGETGTLVVTWSPLACTFTAQDQSALTGTLTVTIGGITVTATPTKTLTKVSETGTTTRTTTYTFVA